MWRGARLGLVVATAGALMPSAPALAAQEDSARVLPTIRSVDLRTLPKARDWQPGDPIKEIPRRVTRPPAPPLPSPPQVDPLVALQAKAPKRAVQTFNLITDFPGGGFSGVQPPDTVGDVGPNHYIQLINFGSGTQIRVYDKNGVLLSGPTPLDSLGTAQCASGLGDPIVLYDQLADRWLLTEFATSGNRFCVYVSQTPDPISGGWFAYNFQATNFPDYPKYGVWPDAFYVTTNENTPAIYAFDRNSMLAGTAAALPQRFTAPPLSGFGFNTLTPADLDGATPPPAGAPGILMRHNDSESHGNPGGPDTVEIWEFHVDFATPANSTFANVTNVQVSEFDSNTCNFSFSCVPQPSGPPLDPLREVIMHRLQYRNFGTHRTLVGNFMTDVGVDQHEVRWFELRQTTGPWGLFQEGTYGPDLTHRWMGAIAMDGTGNIGLAYNVSSTSVFPGLRFTGRVFSDPTGTMPEPETVIEPGTASNSSSRYGDYAAMSIDPVDDCTFWFTGEYNPATQWSTRIAKLIFAECVPVPVHLQGFSVE
jgi:hypothetical protein